MKNLTCHTPSRCRSVIPTYLLFLVAISLGLLLVACGAESDDGPTDAIEVSDDTDIDDPDTADTDVDDTDLDVKPDDVEIDVPTGTCEDVGQRYTAFRNANQSCQTVDDCVTVSSALSCDCFWYELVNVNAEAGALTLLDEIEQCGMDLEQVVGCQADVAPSVSVDCVMNKCSYSAPNSCLVPDFGADADMSP